MNINKNFKLLFFAFSLISVGSSGCYYDVAEELYPATMDCDTANVTFGLDINPLMQQKCLSCHSQSANQGNVNLEGYDQVKSYVDNGKLLGSMAYSSGYSPMPKGEGQLPSCTINRLKAWINSGALNN